MNEPSLSANEVAKNASRLLERVFLMPKYANSAAGGEGLLVLLFEGEGGRAVEAMEAKILTRQPDTLDQCLYRVEFQ